MPPLRERTEDIPLLVEHVLERIASERGEPALALSAEALAKLTRRPWRGNVRELENVLWRVALGGEAAIDESDTADATVRGQVDVKVTVPGEVVSLEEAQDSFTRAYLDVVLARSGGNIAAAARLLGVTRPTLSRLLKRLRSE
jgi:DNA-binding NtrC family response regulator